MTKDLPSLLDATRRACSDLVAGRLALPCFERQAAAILCRGAACERVTLWRRFGPEGADELTRFARAVRGGGACSDAAPSVPLSALPDYVDWLGVHGALSFQADGPADDVVAQALLLEDGGAAARLHVPTYYNGRLSGVACFSDDGGALRWAGTRRRDIRQLLALITTYASTLQPGRSIESAGSPPPRRGQSD
jgi:hypothetical protein